MQTPLVEAGAMSAMRRENETKKVTLGQALRSARRYRQLTGKQLGEKMGMKGPTQIHQVERGSSRPGSFYIERVVETLDIALIYQPKIGWFWLPN